MFDVQSSDEQPQIMKLSLAKPVIFLPDCHFHQANTCEIKFQIGHTQAKDIHN